jgi:hypothetical protein
LRRIVIGHWFSSFGLWRRAHDTTDYVSGTVGQYAFWIKAFVEQSRGRELLAESLRSCGLCLISPENTSFDPKSILTDWVFLYI